MLNRRVVLTFFLPVLPLLFAGYSQGASYPSRPLEIVAPANPGGGWDALARTLNRTFELEKLYPQPMSVLKSPAAAARWVSPTCSRRRLTITRWLSTPHR